MALLDYRFPSYQITWKPIQIARNNKRALAAPYVDIRYIQDALDQLAPAWNSRMMLQHDAAGYFAYCVLEVPNVDAPRAYIERTETGHGETPMDASNQAFRRAACAHGLGRYLWQMPPQWVDYDLSSKTFTDAALSQLDDSLGIDKPDKGRYLYCQELGRTVFGKEWKRISHRNIARLTGGRTSSATDLNANELERLITGMESMVSTAEPQLQANGSAPEDNPFDS